MSIAKVEPLTTARALRGPVRLPAARRDGGRGGGQRRAGARSGGGASLGVVVELAESSDLPPERLAEPIEALETGVPAELVRLGLWVAREYCSTPSRGLQLVLPPGAGVRKRRSQAAGPSCPGVGARRRRRAAAAPRAGAGGRAEIVAALDGEAEAPPRAAPARRHRLGQDRGLPGRGRGGAGAGAGGRSSSSPRSASPRRRWRASAPGSATASPSCTRPSPPASATTSGGGCAAARRASASARARRSSPRSQNLGLIVIDEEHDPSYKQEGDPCYDARAVARRRAEECGAVLVAGTATPRPGVVAGAAAGRAAAPRRRPRHAAGRGARHARRRPALGAAAPRHLGGAGGGAPAPAPRRS